MSPRGPLAAAFLRRFARFATVSVVRRPALWRFFRGPMQRQFDALAPRWDTLRSPDHLVPYETALAAVSPPPRRALDLGTGTGDGARAIAERFPGAEVVGVDLSGRMIEEARRKLPPELRKRVSFEQSDASRLPFPDASFELVAHANMIPFFDELARVLAPSGHAVFGFSSGPSTPIYVPSERLRAELEQRGFAGFEELEAAGGSAFLARKDQGR